MYFLNIYKPKGISSFDVIRQLRKILNIKAIGHSGTLDPLAQGVMQVAVGGATKLLEYLESDKTYVADICFGYTSTTYDDEGEKTFIKEPEFSKNELLECLREFVGITLQTPPKYSAIKLNGKKLCDISRKNPSIEIEIKPREIEIYSINLIKYTKNSAEIEVHCKKGTYIRSLVDDIGKKLGCGAYIKNLIRTKAGSFDIKYSNKLEDNLSIISPIDALNLDCVELENSELNKVLNGNQIIVSNKPKTKNVLLTKNNKLVSIGILSDNLINGCYIIKPKRVFNYNEV